MKQTAMQDLREDLQLTVETAKDALLEIENQEIREACQEVVRLTLKNIINRIDEELLEMEKQQIIEAHTQGYVIGGGNGDLYDTEQYYNETF
jgi:actin-like ATPase involved in cell morphogenesis